MQQSGKVLEGGKEEVQGVILAQSPTHRVTLGCPLARAHLPHWQMRRHRTPSRTSVHSAILQTFIFSCFAFSDLFHLRVQEVP